MSKTAQLNTEDQLPVAVTGGCRDNRPSTFNPTLRGKRRPESDEITGRDVIEMENASPAQRSIAARRTDDPGRYDDWKSQVQRLPETLADKIDRLEDAVRDAEQADVLCDPDRDIFPASIFERSAELLGEARHELPASEGERLKNIANRLAVVRLRIESERAAHEEMQRQLEADDAARADLADECGVDVPGEEVSLAPAPPRGPGRHRGIALVVTPVTRRVLPDED